MIYPTYAELSEVKPIELSVDDKPDTILVELTQPKNNCAIVYALVACDWTKISYDMSDSMNPELGDDVEIDVMCVAESGIAVCDGEFDDVSICDGMKFKLTDEQIDSINQQVQEWMIENFVKDSFKGEY